MRFLQFDLRATRSERLRTEQFVIVSNIMNIIIEICLLYYDAGENVSLDEQLFPSKAHCSFTQCMLQKQDKVSIKFW